MCGWCVGENYPFGDDAFVMLLPDETYEQNARAAGHLLAILRVYDDFLARHRIKPEFFCRYIRENKTFNCCRNTSVLLIDSILLSGRMKGNFLLFVLADSQIYYFIHFVSFFNAVLIYKTLRPIIFEPSKN